MKRLIAACAVAAPLAAGAAPLSDAARTLVAAVVLAHDHGGQPFAVLDKRAARLWIFDGDARLRGSTPVLLGLARGDDSVPGIGERPLAQILPGERTTPAGRFPLEPGMNTSGDHILWVDYDAAVSMHPLRSLDPAERRVERLATRTAADNRISFGCINVPPRFYERVLWPTFSRTPGTAYVLPESRSVERQFPRLFDLGRDS